MLLNLPTLITTFSPFPSYIVVTPSMIGSSQNFLCHSHPGLIWIRLLFPFLPERFFQNDLEDGTPELYYLSGYCLRKIPLSKLSGYWVLQISGVLRSFPVPQLPYQFDQSEMSWFTIIIGSQIFTLMCGIHPRLALGITSNGWNSLQNLTTSPTLLPSIVFRTSIETEWFHVLFLTGYLPPSLSPHPIPVPITLQTLSAKRFQILFNLRASLWSSVSLWSTPNMKSRGVHAAVKKTHICRGKSLTFSQGGPFEKKGWKRLRVER